MKHQSEDHRGEEGLPARRPPRTGLRGHPSWRDVVDAWRASSLHDGWRNPWDWEMAAVEPAAREFLRDLTLSAGTAAALGLARAELGAGIQETLLDLNALYATTGRTPAMDVVSALAGGWEEGSRTSTELGCLDASTGLHSAAHFGHRLREAQEAAARNPGYLVARLRYRAGAAGPQPRLGWSLLAELGACVTRTLGDVPCAAHVPGAVAVLLWDRRESLERLDTCRSALETLRDGALRPVVLTIGWPGSTLEEIAPGEQMKKS